jgi:ATP/maltotriose-dependent transcriptional regulator MalT
LATALRNHRRIGEARAYAEEALDIGQRSGDRAVQAGALITLAATSADLSVAVELFGQASAAAQAAGAHDTQLLVAVTESDMLEAAGEHARAAQVAASGITLARDLGLARTRGTLLAPNLTESLLSLGRWQEATAVGHDALNLSPPPLYRAYLHIIQATIDVRRGDLDQAATAAQQARTIMRGHNRGEESCLEPDLLDCRLAQARHDGPAVLALADHVLADHDLLASPRYGWPLLVAAAQYLPHHPDADDFQTQLLAWGRKLTVTGRLQRAYQLTFDAELGGDWSAATAAWRELDQPYALAQCLLDAARATLSTSDRTAATGMLVEAARIATDLGAGPLRGEVASLAKRARITVEPTESAAEEGNPAGLTPREHEVLELLATGRSNRQIGEHLFISAKTAGVHVSNILAKLGVSTRLEAAAWAHRNRVFHS